MLTDQRPRTRSRCHCGRIKSKFAIECRECWKEQHDRYCAEAQAVVASGVCPLCGATLRQNLSIAGWWQCGRLGSDPFRAVEYQGGPTCDFQTFTQ